MPARRSKDRGDHGRQHPNLGPEDEVAHHSQSYILIPCCRDPAEDMTNNMGVLQTATQ